MPADRSGRSGEQRIELGLIEEADLRLVVLGRRRLVDRPAGVRVGPAFRDRELEDPVQVDVQVADGLHGQLRQAAINPVLGVEAGVDEILDVIGVDLVDGRLAEVRREVDPDLRLVVGEGRVGLAAATGELLNAAVADLGDGHPSRHRRRRGVCLQHQLSQPSLCLRSG